MQLSSALDSRLWHDLLVVSSAQLHAGYERHCHLLAWCRRSHARPSHLPPAHAGHCHAVLQVIDAINALSRGKKDNTATAEDGAIIAAAGQIRKGTYVPNLQQM